MPDTIYSALNTGGTEVVSDAERLRAQLRQQAIDNAFRSQMLGQQNSLAMAQLADRANDRANQLQVTGLQNSGNLALEGQRGQNELGVAGVNTAPAMGELGLRRDQYNEGRPLRDAAMQDSLTDMAVKAALRNQIAQAIPGYSAPSAMPGASINGAAPGPMGGSAPSVGNGLRAPAVAAPYRPPFVGGDVTSTPSAVDGGTSVPLEAGQPITPNSTVPRGSGFIQMAGRPDTRMQFAGAADPGTSSVDALVQRQLAQLAPAGGQGSPPQSMAGQAPSAVGGGAMDPKALRSLSALAGIYGSLKSGTPFALPDYELQDAERAKTLRDLKAGEVKDDLAAGDPAAAAAAAKKLGVVMPRVDPSTLVSRPDIAAKVSSLLALRDEASATFGGADDMSRFSSALDDFVNSLRAQGVAPEEARGLAQKYVLEGDGTPRHPPLQSRYGAISGPLSDAFHLQTLRSVPNMYTQRINTIRGMVGQ